MSFNEVMEDIGRVVDAIGVAAIIIGSIGAAVVALRQAAARQGGVYQGFRQRLGRAILLGLELLVAADIIRTVAATPTLTSVAILAGIVAIRTFLSFSLEVEITGTWPWRQHAKSTGTPREQTPPVEPPRGHGPTAKRPPDDVAW